MTPPPGCSSQRHKKGAQTLPVPFTEKTERHLPQNVPLPQENPPALARAYADEDASGNSLGLYRGYPLSEWPPTLPEIVFFSPWFLPTGIIDLFSVSRNWPKLSHQCRAAPLPQILPRGISKEYHSGLETGGCNSRPQPEAQNWIIFAYIGAQCLKLEENAPSWPTIRLNREQRGTRRKTVAIREASFGWNANNLINKCWAKNLKYFNFGQRIYNFSRIGFAWWQKLCLLLWEVWLWDQGKAWSALGGLTQYRPNSGLYSVYLRKFELFRL